MKIRLCLCTLRTRDQTHVPCAGRQIFHAYFHSMKIRLCNRFWCFCVFLFSCGLWYHHSLHSVGYTFNSCWQVKWNLVLLTNECSQLFSFSTHSQISVTKIHCYKITVTKNRCFKIKNVLSNNKQTVVDLYHMIHNKILIAI